STISPSLGAGAPGSPQPLRVPASPSLHSEISVACCESGRDWASGNKFLNAPGGVGNQRWTTCETSMAISRSAGSEDGYLRNTQSGVFSQKDMSFSNTGFITLTDDDIKQIDDLDDLSVDEEDEGEILRLSTVTGPQGLTKLLSIR